MSPNASAFDPKAEAKRIAFDRTGTGENVLLISGFPQTRRSWNKIVPLLSKEYRTVAADLPSFGDSGILAAPATTENAGRIFHEFVAGVGAPLHVVAHDFGVWVAYSWALLFPDDFQSLTLIDAGIPGVTLTNEIQLSDYKRKWNFIFQMLPDLPAVLTAQQARAAQQHVLPPMKLARGDSAARIARAANHDSGEMLLGGQ